MADISDDGIMSTSPSKDKKHTILVIEPNPSLRQRIQDVLSGHGYPVKSFDDAFEALEDLNMSKPSAYTVIISGYRMPKLKGDEILKKAKEISPNTQRILMVDVSELDTLIKAVNYARIHSCLLLPFEDQDLLLQVDQCCRQYDLTRKQNHFHRLTQRQNRQLFLMASNFKQKEVLFLAQLEQKKKEVRVLESRLRFTGSSLFTDRPVLLKDVLAGRQAHFSPERFAVEFMLIKDDIKQILETAAAPSGKTLPPVLYQTLSGPAILNPDHKALVEAILPLFYACLKKNTPGMPLHETVNGMTLGDVFTIRVSKDHIQAFLTVETTDLGSIHLFHVKQFLEKNKITHGIKPDHDIEAWLLKTRPTDEAFVVAEGKKPVYPKNAQVLYHFPIEYLHAGKVKADGSIDFQDRGDIPFAEEGFFLAEKIPPEYGSPGMDVFGNQTEVEDPFDLIFSCGPGTRLSEDGARIYATTSGQPHLDALGNISVYPEFEIKGDLGFETGHVNFDGNVIVTGRVKQGFKVKCASLTAMEIQGAEIDITGDLNVSLGIVDTKMVRVKGSVQAKFIHNSEINAFGDLIIQREIIDSKIYLSGACINKNGLIINSIVSAKMGIHAGSIGKPAAGVSSLTVGVDENTNQLVEIINSQQRMNKTEIQDLEAQIMQLEKEDQTLHGIISQYAHVQDRSQLSLNALKQKLTDLKGSVDSASYQKLLNTVKQIKQKATEAEKQINTQFDRQNDIALDIYSKSTRIKEIENQNMALADEKKRLLVFSLRKTPLPELKVAGKIESKTKIFAPNSSLILQDPSSRCSIRELSKSPGKSGSGPEFEMQIGNY